MRQLRYHITETLSCQHFPQKNPRIQADFPAPAAGFPRRMKKIPETFRVSGIPYPVFAESFAPEHQKL